MNADNLINQIKTSLQNLMNESGYQIVECRVSFKKDVKIIIYLYHTKKFYKKRNLMNFSHNMVKNQKM